MHWQMHQYLARSNRFSVHAMVFSRKSKYRNRLSSTVRRRARTRAARVIHMQCKSSLHLNRHCKTRRMIDRYDNSRAALERLKVRRSFRPSLHSEWLNGSYSLMNSIARSKGHAMCVCTIKVDVKQNCNATTMHRPNSSTPCQEAMYARCWCDLQHRFLLYRAYRHQVTQIAIRVRAQCTRIQ